MEPRGDISLSWLSLDAELMSSIDFLGVGLFAFGMGCRLMLWLRTLLVSLRGRSVTVVGTCSMLCLGSSHVFGRGGGLSWVGFSPFWVGAVGFVVFGWVVALVGDVGVCSVCFFF